MKEKGIYVAAAEAASTYAQYDDGNLRAQRAHELVRRAARHLIDRRQYESSAGLPAPELMIVGVTGCIAVENSISIVANRTT